ncbi:hypothetical protein LGM38_29075 [Burkholderia vietnamiensis]|uniref:hypothetical protein n=1 Tax=Burkholderia vietnamiensis TaxID=60552 RepID=UPI001CF50F37|nr:hypothetical protein [Burkholderia vietnamiensis]MCA8016101.1 hypothetical protein [Burkholderia vietnamiensis]HDR8940091.1 hypothetical protein [Burkholderia vietnamiensis]HDR9265168.1 hypothetical protein [Burkholderia vietnamiensis]
MSAVKPEWPELNLPHGVKEDTRVAPHILVRSAVFSTLEYAGAAQRPTIVQSEPMQLDAMSQYHVEQLEGPRLSQSDADLLFWLLARAYRDGDPKDSATVFFKRAEALAALGRSRGGKTDALLNDSLQRLCLAEFNFEQRDAATGEMQPLARTRLLSKVDCPADKSAPYDYRVTIAGGVATLLRGNAWLALSGQVRKMLASDPLAKGLHVHFASNKKVFDVWPDTLKGLMGRESMKQDSKWLRVLELALAKVGAATRWPQCELAKSGPSAGKVVVKKGAPRPKLATDEASG